MVLITNVLLNIMTRRLASDTRRYGRGRAVVRERCAGIDAWDFFVRSKYSCTEFKVQSYVASTLSMKQRHD